MSVWKSLHKRLLDTDGTIGVEFDSGEPIYFEVKTNKSINRRTVNTLLEKGLIRPTGMMIDPSVPQAYEACHV